VVLDAETFAIERTGKILVAGSSLQNGAEKYVVRLNPGGTLDNSFQIGSNQSQSTFALAVQADDKVLAARQNQLLGRFNPDGTLDGTFQPATTGEVYSVIVQKDGKILVAGRLASPSDGVPYALVRLNSDGSLDSGFARQPDWSVDALALQPDGKILMAGDFRGQSGESRTNLLRLNRDGTVDPNFHSSSAGSDGDLFSIAVQANGKILVGGHFSTLDGQGATDLARLNADGTLDTSFHPGLDYYGSILSIVLQTDGKILVGGEFNTPRDAIARFNPDGTLDEPFAPVADYSVTALGLQADGKIVISGYFDSLGGQSRRRIGRLTNPTPATQSLSSSGSALTWLRGGSSPEVWRITFESSSNGGGSWVYLGDGIRIPGGWQLTGLNISTNALIRARGYTAGGRFNACGSLVEAMLGPPLLVTQPVSVTNNATTTAEFAVYAGGAPPLTYRWLKNSVLLSDSDRVTGSTSADLMLTNVLGPDGADYSVIVSNSSGSITSAVATLTVIDPIIAVSPTNQIGQPGGAVTFRVEPAGTQPFGFQWRKEGLPWRRQTIRPLRLAISLVPTPELTM